MFGHWKEDRLYLENKYRRDSSDSSTGLALDDLINELVRLDEKEWRALPCPAAKAAAFEFLCRNVRIDVSPRDFFPAFGCWDRARRPMAPLIAARAERVRKEKLHYNELWDSLNGDGSIMLWIDFDHSAPDWDAVFSLGFAGILRRAEEYRESFGHAGKSTPESEVYFDGVIKSWRAALELLRRLRDLAMSRAAGSPRLAFEADSLDRLLSAPPENTYDALMLIYLYFFLSEHLDHMQVRSLGNLDDRLWPFVRRDLERGLFTEAQIRELLDYFLMQWGSINNYWGQPVYLGGTALDGSCLCNPVSLMLLEEYGKLDIISPKFQLKVDENTPDAVLGAAFDLIRRSRSLVFVCEPGMRTAMRKLGFSDEEARTCDITGCYEFCPRGTSVVTAVGYVNMLKIFEELDTAPAPSFDDYFDRYWNALKIRLEDVIRITDDFEAHLGEINPAQIFSGTILHSLETARDAFACGSVHNNTSLLCCGFASAVDSLSMIREFVCEKGVLSLAEWRRILQSNWKGSEALRARVLNSPNRFGNHRVIPDSIAAELAARMDCLVNGRPNARGGLWMVSSHPARAFIDLGKATGATPDGRRAGEVMSQNLSPVAGMDREGCTALLESVVWTGGPARFPGDACLDLMLPPSSVAGPEGFRVLKSLLFYYLRHGGHALQFNILDSETLLDARRHPEKYGSLMVRVCGWNTRFTDMAPAEQAVYIKRAAQAEGVAP